MLQIALAAFLLLLSGTSVHAQSVQWEQTNGPTHAIVHLLTSTADGLVWSLGSNRIYRSDDDGQTWARTSLLRRDIISLAATDQGEVFAVPNFICNLECFQDPVFYSDDAGETWRPMRIVPEGTLVRSIVVGAQGRVFADAGGGVLMKDALADTWQPASLDNVAIGVRTLTATPDGLVAGATNDAIYLSTDNGATWTRQPHSRENFFIDRLALVDATTFFAEAVGDLVRSTDGGATWEDVAFPTGVGKLDLLKITAEGHVLLGADQGAFLSTDLGETWTLISPPGFSIRAFTTTATGTDLIGTVDTVFRMPPGETWERSGEGFTETEVTVLTALADGGLVAGTFFNGVFRTDDGGQTWQNLGFPERASVEAIIETAQGDLLVGIFGEPGLYRLAAGETEWASLGLENIGSLVQGAHNTLFAGAIGRLTHGVYRSEDLGATWTLVGLENEEINALAAEASGTLYAGTLGGGVFRSTDSGASWDLVGLDGENIQVLALRPEETVFAGTFDGTIYRSDDGGDTWAPVYTSAASVSAFTVTPGPVVFAATDATILRSPDRGLTWEPFPTEFPLEERFTLSLARDDRGHLYAGTWGSGVFRSIEPIASANEKPRDDVPALFALSSNYPNPFRGETTIAFELREAAPVRLSLYDTSGREVAVLAAGMYPAGQHAVVWQAEGFPSGLYLYRLQAGSHQQGRSLVLLK